MCPGHLPPCSGHSTVVNGTSPGLVSSPAHPGHSPGASGRGGLLTGWPPPSVRHQGLEPGFCQPPGPTPSPSGGLRTRSWAAEQPVGSVALTGAVPPPAAVAAGSLFMDDDFQVDTGQSGPRPRALFPSQFSPRAVRPCGRGTHAGRELRAPPRGMGRSFMFVLCLCVFLKWSAIIFTIKGSYKSSDFSEKHSQLRASGGLALVLSQGRISVGSLVQSNEGFIFLRKVHSI